MRLKNSLISVLLIIFTSNSAAQFGSELGGETLQESFVNFMQTITLVNITSVATAFLFLTVVALFYFASLNIFEQVFLRLEEIIKEALGEDARSIYRDNDHYPTGVKGMALAVAFISANGITGLIGLLSGIALGLIGVAIPLVVHGKLLNIVSDTYIDDEGNLSRGSENNHNRRNGARNRRTSNSGNSGNINGDPTMDPQEVVNIIQIIENAEREIQEVEEIEEEEYKEAEKAKDKLEEEIANMEERLEEDVSEKIKEILRYKNKSDADIGKYMENPEDNKHEIRRINFSGSSDRKEKRTLSGKVSRTIDKLESRAVSLEQKVSNNEFGADYEALNKLEKIKIENHEIFEDYKAAIKHIKQETDVSDEIDQILKEVTKPKNLKYAGIDDMEDRKNIDEMVKDFREQKDKMESIEESVDKVNKILNDEDLPELDAIRKKTESRKKLVGYLLNEDEESDLSRKQIKQIKNALKKYESRIEKAEDLEKSQLEEIYSHHEEVHSKAEELEETVQKDINPKLKRIFNAHNMTSQQLQSYLTNTKQLNQDIKQGNISFSTEDDILRLEEDLLQEIRDLREDAREDKQLDERDYEETKKILKENHEVIKTIKELKSKVQNLTGGENFDKTMKEFIKKDNWSAAGLDYDKDAKKLAETLMDAEEKVQEIEQLAENLEEAEQEEFDKIEKIDSQLESREIVVKLIEEVDKTGGTGTGNNKSDWKDLISYYDSGSGWRWMNVDNSKIPTQGWKIHIGADADKPKESRKVVEVLSSLLTKSGVYHKFSPSLKDLKGQSGNTEAKICTIYPFQDKGKDMNDPKQMVNANKENTDEIINRIAQALKTANLLRESGKVTTPGEKCVTVNGNRSRIYVRYEVLDRNIQKLHDINGEVGDKRSGIEPKQIDGLEDLGFSLSDAS